MMNTTEVELKFLEMDFERVKALLGRQLDDYDVYHLIGSVDLVSLNASGLSGGDLGFEERLQKAKIPYSKEFSDEFDEIAGEEHFRVGVGDGACKLSKFESEETGVVSLGELGRAIEKGFDEVQALHARLKKKYDVLSWKEQLDIYETKNAAC